MNAQPLWVELARITIGFIFFAAALAKWRRPSAFSRALESYDLVTKAAVRPLAFLVLSLETVLAAMLLLGVLVDVALVGSAAALAAFAGVVARTVLRDTAVDCGCLGAAVPLRLGWTTAVANALLSVAAVTAALLDAGGAAPRDTWFVIWASGFVMAALYWLAAYSRTVLTTVEEHLSTGLVR